MKFGVYEVCHVQNWLSQTHPNKYQSQRAVICNEISFLRVADIGGGGKCSNSAVFGKIMILCLKTNQSYSFVFFLFSGRSCKKIHN